MELLPYRQNNIFHCIPFIIVHTSLHADNRHLSDIAKDKPSAVSGDCRDRESLDIMVVYYCLHLNLIPVISETGSEYQCDFRNKICFFTYTFKTFDNTIIYSRQMLYLLL